MLSKIQCQERGKANPQAERKYFWNKAGKGLYKSVKQILKNLPVIK